jgi:hypothetical protein
LDTLELQRLIGVDQVHIAQTIICGDGLRKPPSFSTADGSAVGMSGVFDDSNQGVATFHPHRVQYGR